MQPAPISSALWLDEGSSANSTGQPWPAAYGPRKTSRSDTSIFWVHRSRITLFWRARKFCLPFFPGEHPTVVFVFGEQTGISTFVRTRFSRPIFLRAKPKGVMESIQLGHREGPYLRNEVLRAPREDHGRLSNKIRLPSATAIRDSQPAFLPNRIPRLQSQGQLRGRANNPNPLNGLNRSTHLPVQSKPRVNRSMKDLGSRSRTSFDSSRIGIQPRSHATFVRT